MFGAFCFIPSSGSVKALLSALTLFSRPLVPHRFYTKLETFKVAIIFLLACGWTTSSACPRLGAPLTQSCCRNGSCLSSASSQCLIFLRKRVEHLPPRFCRPVRLTVRFRASFASPDLFLRRCPSAATASARARPRETSSTS
jgi:hypothetical protein